MAISGSAVNLSTLLLEKNRANGKGPSLLVSEWIEETGEAGFAGLEIWINHLTFASRSEWELIAERSRDSDLPIAALIAALPVDASDKGQRYRDSVIEALDYFRPDTLKFTLADRNAEALAFVKEWSRDVPRDTGLLYDPGEAPGPQALAEARALLEGGRFKAVLHPFLLGAKELEAALDAAGPFAGNMGVQARGKGGKAQLLEDAAEEHKKIIAAVRGKGFQGTWTLESTLGAGLPGEDIEDLFDNAERDLNFLIEAQSRAAKAR